MSEALFVSVALDRSLAKPLDYSVPSDWAPSILIGSRVEVPLKTTLKKGIVVEIKEKSSFAAVRPIHRILSTRGALSPPLWKMAEWMATYYAAPLSKVLKCFIPPHIRREVQQKKQLFLSLVKSDEESRSACIALRTSHPAQALLLEKLLAEKKGLFLAHLLKEGEITRAPVDALIKKRFVKSQEVSSDEDFLLEEPFFPTHPKALNGEQKKCLDAISLGEFAVHLILGVTGSGKTEVYLQAIQKALDAGKSAILLVPEISLTSQTIERLSSRFPEKLAILHHRRSLGERAAAWEKLQKGEIRILIGARSAVFGPIQNLGLLIVDEEHDSSYKQSEEMPCYQARDLAVLRGQLEQAVVLLGSATPSLESRTNAELGKYKLHYLNTRATQALMPRVQIVDMKRAREQSGGFTHFCPEVLNGIKKRLGEGEQTLLLLNRRGTHRMQICSGCREILKCPHCDLSLTYHKIDQLLRCHTCDFTRTSPRQCPSCQATESLEFKGFGTEHVERSLHAIFPEIRTLRMDRDTTRAKNSHEELFRQFRSHKADVLIGTQMIAKGFHFPSVTLVAVLNVDGALSIPDFRAAEQTFQLLTQVAGRAGRSELPGEVIFQTFLPEHPVFHLAAAQNFEAFYQKESAERRQFGYPPFCHLVKCLFSANTSEKAQSLAEAAHAFLQHRLPAFAHLLPALPAGHPKLKDLYRFQFLIKTPKILPLSPLLTHLNSEFSAKVDIDPLTTFF